MTLLIMSFFFLVILFSLLWHDETSERPPNSSPKQPNHGHEH
jgi:hypothetical protein